ncbi:MAG: cytoplasmic protein [Pseudomonadota bacterium]
MADYTHKFVEDYQGLVGFGLDRETDESSLVCYLQMFSNDELMAVLKKRFSDDDIEEILDLVSRQLRKHLTEEEYHTLFLGDAQHQ